MCEGCKKWPALKGLRFCSKCLNKTLAAMERDRYLVRVSPEVERALRFIEDGKNAKSQRGRSK